MASVISIHEINDFFADVSYEGGWAARVKSCNCNLCAQISKRNVSAAVWHRQRKILINSNIFLSVGNNPFSWALCMLCSSMISFAYSPIRHNIPFQAQKYVIRINFIKFTCAIVMCRELISFVESACVYEDNFPIYVVQRENFKHERQIGDDGEVFRMWCIPVYKPIIMLAKHCIGYKSLCSLPYECCLCVCWRCYRINTMIGK